MKAEKEITLYTIEEVVEILQVTRRTIYSYIQDGKLPAVKVGGRYWRVKAEDLKAFIDNGAK